MNFLGMIPENKRVEWLNEALKLPWSPSVGERRNYLGWTDGEVLFTKIEPGGEIHPHSDTGWKRHYVLQTNPGAINYVDGVAYDMQEGGVYEFDSSLEHWSTNNGDSDRIHRIEL